MHTKPSPARARLPKALGVFAVLLFTACGFADGQPWGTLNLHLSAALDEAGRGPEVYPTRLDYALSEVRIDLDFAHAQFTQAGSTSGGAGAGGAPSFDPANPPAGYSLCHNGHCHADSGELVAYEDIAAALNSAPGQRDTAPVVGGALSGSLTLQPTPQPVAFTCDGECALSRAELTQMSVQTGTVRVRAHIADLRTGERARLDDEGRDLDITLPALTFTAPLAESFGNQLDPQLDIDAVLSVSVVLFDAIDWGDPKWDQALSGTGEAAAALISAISDAFVESTTISTVVRRSKAAGRATTFPSSQSL